MERGGSNERIVGPQVCQFKYCYELPTLKKTLTVNGLPCQYTELLNPHQGSYFVSVF